MHLYIINKIKTIKTINPQNIDPSNSLFVTVEFLVKCELGKLGLKVYYLDGFIPAEMGQKYNLLISKLAREWYVGENGKDVFEIEGISLGDVFYYYFNHLCIKPFLQYYLNLQEIIKRHQIAEVFLDDANEAILGALKIIGIKNTFINIDDNGRSEPDDLIVLKYQKVNPNDFRLTYFFVAKVFAFIINLINQLRQKLNKKDNVLILGYGPTKVLINNLIDKKDLVFRLNTINFGNRRLYIKGSGKIFLFKDYRNIYNKKLTGLLQKWKELVQTNHFRAKFVFEGKDCSEYIKKRMTDIISNNLFYFYDQIVGVELFLNRNKIKLVILPFDGPWFARLLVLVCRKLNIKTMILINGYMGDDFQLEAKLSDIKIAYSSSIKRNYFKDVNNVHICGNPVYDCYCDRPKRRHGHKQMYNVLINPFSYSVINMNCFFSLSEEYLKDITEVLREFKNVNIMIKLNPSDSHEYYLYLIKEIFKLKNVKIYHKEKFSNVVNQANLYITNWSTSNFEAAILNVPVIYYKRDALVLHPPFDWKSEHIMAKDKDELEKYIEMFFAGDPKLWEFNKVEVLEKYTGPLDGKSSERILDLINNEIK